MRITVSKESAIALRTFAEAMPFTIENIRQDTERLVQVYQSVADSVGPHEQAFASMLMLIKSAQEAAAEAIQALPAMLVETADRIDAYVAMNPTISG